MAIAAHASWTHAFAEKRQRLAALDAWLIEDDTSACLAPGVVAEMFTTAVEGVQCFGLSQARAASALACAAQCCTLGTACQVWQWCPPGSTGDDCAPATSCWIGLADDCAPREQAGWTMRTRSDAAALIKKSP